MKILALRVIQPLGEFFVTSLKARTLVGRVENRPRSSQEPSNRDIQRVFSEKRVREISDFTGDPQATFPTPIIIAVRSDVVKQVEIDQECLGQIEHSFSCFDLPDDGLIGDVLDGQHRVLGLQRSDHKDEFDLPVVMMFDLEPDDKAFVFSIINSKQTPVKASLIYDLFGLSEYRSPQKTAHFVAQSLNVTEGSPFRGRLKMLGHKESHHEKRVMLSQGSFGARLVDLISKDPAADATAIKERKALADNPKCPLRKYFIKGEDEAIFKITMNYFSAVAAAFEIEWNDDDGNYVIRKTVGYTALIIVLRHLMEIGFDQKNLSRSFFDQQVARLKDNLGNTPLTSESFPSSGAGAITMAKQLLGVNDLKFEAIATLNASPEEVVLVG